MTIDFNDKQRDALTEIMNIAIGRAAHALNQMVKEEIILSIPEIGFYGREQALILYSDLFDGPVGAVKQRFESTFSGDALLVFPERQSLSLVQHILGDLVDDESMTELEQETMSEVGNVVLNASLSSLADQLGTTINSSLPQYSSKSLHSLFENSTAGTMGDEYILCVKVDFRMHKSEISGYIMLVVDIASAQTFMREVDAYVVRAIGD